MPRIAGRSGTRRAARSSRRSPSRSRASAPCASRAPQPATSATSSARDGTASSAAAVGVGARRSEAKSTSVVSVSCPTAVMIGQGMAATARTTASSLKAMRSSRLPPPRARITTSGRGTGPPSGSEAMRASAAAMRSAAPSPCTGTGQIWIARGKRRATVVRMSWITAPCALVTTAMTRGSSGTGRLRASSNSPAASSFAFSASMRASIAPAPAYSSRSTVSWYAERSP